MGELDDGAGWARGRRRDSEVGRRVLVVLRRWTLLLLRPLDDWGSGGRRGDGWGRADDGRRCRGWSELMRRFRVGLDEQK